MKILNQKVKRYTQRKCILTEVDLDLIKIDPMLKRYFSKNIFMADYEAGREIWRLENWAEKRRTIEGIKVVADRSDFYECHKSVPDTTHDGR